MANYKVISTAENVKWPAYVSTVPLAGEQQLEKAEKVLDKALVTLEAYGGPHFAISQLKSAARTSIFLYEILVDLVDSSGEIRECVAMILNEPWMKANSIAAATFEFADNGIFDDNAEKLVIKRKKSIKYYKDSEVIYEEQKTKVIKEVEEEEEECEDANSNNKLVTDV